MKDNKNIYKIVKCPQCGVEREVRVIRGVPQGGLCRKCARRFW